jgi:hypothetical protein
MIERFYDTSVEDRVAYRGALPGGVATKLMRNYVDSSVGTFVINERALEDR